MFNEHEIAGRAVRLAGYALRSPEMQAAYQGALKAVATIAEDIMAAHGERADQVADRVVAGVQALENDDDAATLTTIMVEPEQLRAVVLRVLGVTA